MDSVAFWELINKGEDAELECKLAGKGIVPKEMWYTYSAFANTNGGIILLGVEEKDKEFYPVDVDVVRLQKDLWDNINNRQKISENILQNDDVVPMVIEGKNILKIVVPRAVRQQKPVYIGQNPLTGTYRRNFEGDYRCKEQEVQQMIAEQTSSSQDSQILTGFGISDLNMESYKSYRQRFSTLKPDSTWNELDNIAFLSRIGGWAKNRKTNEEGLTVAGLLMFGDEDNITEIFSHYFLDYREKRSDVPDQRWTNRITSQDGTWSGNIYDFYFRVIGRITSDIEIPFQISGNEYIRQTETRVHKALREAVLNTLIHANYYGETGVVIEKGENFFRFSNPGILRLPLEKAVAGGNSDPRNPMLFKMFAQIGLGERSGYGLESIHTTWKQQHWRKPALVEEFQPERTILTLLPTSLIPSEIVEYLRGVLKDRFHTLTPDELLVLVTAQQEGSVNNVRMQELTGKYPKDVNKLLSDMVDEKLLSSKGIGRGTTYLLSDMFYNQGGHNTIGENFSFSNDNGNLGNKDIRSGSSLGNKGIGYGNNGISLGNKDIRSGNSSGSLGNKGLVSTQPKELDGSIDKTLFDIARPAREKLRMKKNELREVILSLCSDRYLTMNELSYYLKRDKGGLRKNHMKQLVEMNKLKMRYPQTPNHQNQAYKSVSPKKG